MRFAACSLLMIVLVAGPAFQSAHAQDAGKPTYAASTTAKFMTPPGLPACTKTVVLSGDPSKEGSLMLVKVATGCVIPWHWHTPTEVLMFVSGHGKGEMKGGSAPIMLHPGDYLSMPGKGVHQFTCVLTCSFFLSSDGAFDIHYLDASGKEIPPDQALKSKAKAPAKKEMNDMKDMKM
jgi:quercetin dioxygenase-like cupin family protein